EPDHFITFGTTFRIPLLGSLMGSIDGLNFLPILLGCVFFIQQKYLTPPPTTTLSPEQQQQQAIMKVVMVVMFPLMMYNTPSGLVLYFLANSTLAILESRYIRRHADKLDLLKKGVVAAGVGTGMFDRKDRQPPAKPGFLQRIQQMAEERQRMQQRNQGG